jgi:hypothetical protein
VVSPVECRKSPLVPRLLPVHVGQGDCLKCSSFLLGKKTHTFLRHSKIPDLLVQSLPLTYSSAHLPVLQSLHSSSHIFIQQTSIFWLTLSHFPFSLHSVSPNGSFLVSCLGGQDLPSFQ